MTRKIEVIDDGYFRLKGFDGAIVGVTESIDPKLVYDKELLLAILMNEDKMSEEDSYDYIYHSITTLESVIVIDSSEFEQSS